MSHTTIIGIWPGEMIQKCLPELRNAWGSAPVVWETLYEEYIHDGFNWLTDLDKLWPLWKELSIPEAHRAVLMMTFDGAYVVKKDYKRASKDIEIFLKDFPQNPEHINHWPSIGVMFYNDLDIPAIGFWHTSVSNNPFNGPWNDEKEERDPPDWDKFYDLYAALDELKH